MTTIITVHPQPRFEVRLGEVLNAQGRPKLPDWFTFPEATPRDELLFPVSNKTDHLFVLLCEYEMGRIYHSLGQCLKPDEKEARVVADIWELHLRGILEHYLRREVTDQELGQYDIRSGWYLAKTNLSADIQAKIDAASK